MSFLHPLALLGLAAAAIPVLLHLLQRRQPPELPFPAVRYLSDAERRSARRLKLRHRLLLLLRTLLVTSVVLAAARPLVPVRGSVSGAHPPAAVAVILDNSVSSGAVSGGAPVLERLRVAARSALQRTTDGDRAFLVLADGVVRAGSRAELIAVVDSGAVAATRLDLAAVVTRAARAVAAQPLAVREVHVFSDLQATALGDTRAVIPEGVRVLALSPAGAPPANRGIADAAPRDGAIGVSVSGTSAAGAAPVTLIVNGREAARALAAPGQTVALALPVAGVAGWRTGVVRLPADELRADDERPVAWRVAPPPAVTADAAAGPFVAAALAVLREAGRVTAGTAVRVGDRPGPRAIIVPPADAALVGATNRALAAAGVGWRFGAPGSPGVIAAVAGLGGDSVPVRRRYRLEGRGGDTLATVNGEPWLVRAGDALVVASRLDTTWTALPVHPAFVPFVERLVAEAARAAAPVTTVEGATGIAFETRGRDTVGVTVAGPDPRESDLAPAGADTVAAALGAALVSDAAFAGASFGGAGRADLAGVLLVIALLLAAAEAVIAWRTR